MANFRSWALEGYIKDCQNCVGGDKIGIKYYSVIDGVWEFNVFLFFMGKINQVHLHRNETTILIIGLNLKFNNIDYKSRPIPTTDFENSLQ